MNPLTLILSWIAMLKGTKKIHWIVPIATGCIAVTAAVALMYMLPPYIVALLNNTGLFAAADVAAASAAVTTVLAICFLIIVIGLLWIVIGIVSAKKGKMG